VIIKIQAKKSQTVTWNVERFEYILDNTRLVKRVSRMKILRGDFQISTIFTMTGH